jgi:apolipoprotein D and lipocalin family protein
VRRRACRLLAALAGAAGLQFAPAPLPAQTSPAPLQAVPQLEIDRYMGTWYQIALYPNRFQAQCLRDTTATYRRLDDGTVEVTNRCTRDNGTRDEIVGRARAAGKLSDGKLVPAQLEVRFAPQWLAWLPLVWANYWVIQLADDYRYAVVSEPKREYLWILARKPQLAAEDERLILARLREQGFDTGKLQRSPQQ